jgi:ABC-type transport system involved in Fe-S cluster assembly, permease component
MSENYKYGFVTDIENEAFEKGLNEDIIRRASALRGEPQFMLDFRLKAYEKLKTMEQPNWGELSFTPVDLQDIVYYSAPKTKKSHEKIEDVDPELLATFEKLGIPLDEQKRLANVAVDAVFDSVSIYTSHKRKLMEMGILFCSISDAIKDIPNSSRNTWEAWSRLATTILRHSTAQSLVTEASCTSRPESSARWTFPPTSASTTRKRASSNAP